MDLRLSYSGYTKVKYTFRTVTECLRELRRVVTHKSADKIQIEVRSGKDSCWALSWSGISNREGKFINVERAHSTSDCDSNDRIKETRKKASPAC